MNGTFRGSLHGKFVAGGTPALLLLTIIRNICTLRLMTPMPPCPTHAGRCR
jgi:hypothetical protein